MLIEVGLFARQLMIISSAAVLTVLTVSCLTARAEEGNFLPGDARSAFRKGEIEAALRLCTRYIQQHPNEPAPYIGRAEVLRTQNKEQLALEDYARVIAINPSLPQAYLERGRTYVEIKNNDLALKDMNTLLKLDPENLSGHGLRASLEDGKKNFPAAVQDLTFIIEKEDPGKKRKAFLKARAVDYEKMGAIDKALKDYAQLAAESRHDDGAILDAARGFDRLGNTDGAIKLIDQLVSQFPDDDEAFKMRGDLYMKKKRYDLALAAYKKAESLDQFDSTIKAAREQAQKLLKAGAK